MTPMPDGKGVDVAQVINVDPAGSIPDIAKKITAKSQSMNLYHYV